MSRKDRPHQYTIRVDADDEDAAIETAREGLFAGTEILEARAERVDGETFEVTLRYRPPAAKLTRN